MKMKFSGCFLITFFLMSFVSAAAAETPLPPRKEQSLQALQEKVANEKSRQHELSALASKQAKDLNSLRKDLVRTAGAVQKHEKSLAAIEQEVAVLKVKKAKLAGDLQADRNSLSLLIIAMERLRRLPPETLILKPGASRETAQAATALGSIIPELHRRAEDLKKKLLELDIIEASLEKNQADLKVAYLKLQDEKTKMDAMIDTRSRAYTETQSSLKDQQRAVAEASREAENFSDLIAKVEARNRELERARKREKDKALPSLPAIGKPRFNEDDRALASTLPGLGAAQLPVSGIVRVRYGEADEIGAASEGIRIESRPGALIVAPMGGIVRYAGDFKSYGNIILLEHKNNYHSLIAGLGRIDTVVGQSVDAGEPVGSLGEQSGSRPSLYYELRLNGKPVNPARKFTDLGT